MVHGPWSMVPSPFMVPSPWSMVLLLVMLVYGSWSLVPGPAFAQAPQGSARLPSADEVFTQPTGAKEPTPTPPSTPPSAPSPAAPAEEPKKEEAQTQSPGEEQVYLNVNDQDIKEVIKQISKATGRNFIIDSKVSGKVTILSNKMMSKDEAYQAFLSALQMAGFTTVTGPAGILKIVPLRDAKNFPIPTHIDTTPYTDTFITRLIKMERVSASDMVEALKGLISKDGNLFAYPETNTLVITDSGTNIDRLMKIIKELDQEGPEQVVEIIPLHYASAKELSSIVLSLFEEQKGQAARGGGRQGGGLEEIAQVSKIIADERTNSIIVLANKRSIDKVKALINKLDAKLEEGSEGKIHVYYLKYAKAKDLATVLTGLAGQAAKAPGQGGGAAGGATLADFEDFKIVSDDPTNSLLITSNAKTFDSLVEKVISKLDIPRKQVYLEAMVIEFSVNRKKQFGVSGSGGSLFGSTVGFGETFQQMAGLFDPFNPSNSGSPFLTAPGLLGGFLSRRMVNITVPKTDGTTQTVSVPAFSAFLTALDTFGDTNIVSSPNLLALDNEESTIEIIKKEPEPGQNILGPAGLVQTGPPQRVDAGLTLKLTPQITEKGTVRMKIDQKFSSFVSPADPSLKAQAIVERKVQTSVVTNDGQTVVIGGLMEDQVGVARTKIPVLGDIPLLGYLFQKRETKKNKSNLLLFVTPHIIRDSGDFETVLKRKLGQQNDFLEKNFKKGEVRDIKTSVRNHNSELLDILEKAPASSSAPVAGAAPSGAPPVITAKPEEEKSLNLVLPPTAKLPVTEPTPPTPSPPVETKAAAPVKETPPAAQPLPSAPPPVQVIPPKKPIKQASAKSQPPSDLQESPKTKHAPVITLPQGTSPDLGE